MVTAGESLAKRLELMILRGEMSPRERLVEIELGAKFNVSRFLVRKAIQDLAKKGLVEVIPHKGGRVVGPSEESIREMLRVRLSLELFATELMVKKINPQKLAQIKKAQEEYCHAVRSGNFEAMIEKNELFHEQLYKTIENNFLHEIIEKARNLTYNLRYIGYYLPGRGEASIADHEAMIDALERKDIEKLRTITESSVSFPMNLLLKKAIQDHVQPFDQREKE